MHPGSLPLAMRVVRFSVSPSCSRPVVVVVLLLLLCPLFLHPWPDPACYVMHTTPRRDNITSSIVITITTTTICNTYVIQIPQARSSFRPSTNEQARSATPAHPSPSPRRLGVLLDDGRVRERVSNERRQVRGEAKWRVDAGGRTSPFDVLSHQHF